MPEVLIIVLILAATVAIMAGISHAADHKEGFINANGTLPPGMVDTNKFAEEPQTSTQKS